MEISSLFFITNVCHALYKHAYIYSIVFLFLLYTSLLWHSSDKSEYIMKHTYWLDQVALILVFLVGLWYVIHINILYKMLAFFSILIVLFLFYGGKILNRYCYDPDEKTAAIYHSSIHIIGAIGHHCIMLGLS